MNRFRSTAIFSILVAAVLFFCGCREHTLISSSLSPANDTAGVHADTLGCITHTFFSDDVITSYNAAGLPEYAAVGSITDSFFGNTNASAFFQVANSQGLLAIDTSAHIDSVVLQLPYSGFTYGDSGNLSLTQTYQVFYMGDTLGYNTLYGPSATKAVDMAYPLSDPVTVKLHNLADSVYSKWVNLQPALRIKLKMSTAMSRINNAIYQASAAGDPASAFVNYFNGICVRPADNRVTTKALPYFRLNGSDDYTKAGILVYYHNSTYPDSVQHFSFLHEQAVCAHFNNITRSYSRFPVNNLYQSIQANDSIIAIQNQPGATVDIKIPGITKLPKNVAINKAEIQISLLPSLNNSVFFPHDQVYPAGIGNGAWPGGIDAGAEYTVLDRYPTGVTSVYAVLDGSPHTLTYGSTGITTYTIGLPREVIASAAAGNDTLHYHIRGTQLLYGAYRMIAGGGSYSDPRYRAKLIVVYSSLKK